MTWKRATADRRQKTPKNLSFQNNHAIKGISLKQDGMPFFVCIAWTSRTKKCLPLRHQDTKDFILLFFLSVLVPWWREEKSFATKSTKLTIKKLNKGLTICSEASFQGGQDLLLLRPVGHIPGLFWQR